MNDVELAQLFVDYKKTSDALSELEKRIQDAVLEKQDRRLPG